MIYLDNASTSWPKPPAVVEAMRDFAENWAANPDRSCHRMGMASSQRVASARSLLAELINAPDPSRIVFTLNGTDALNMALKGFLNDGDRVVTTSFEHNSLARPLNALERAGRITVARIAPDDGLRVSPEAVARVCSAGARLVAVTAVSNVFGALNDLKALCAAARKAGAAILIDAAQAVGCFDIDVSDIGADMMAFPCHKGLFGPMGTGALYVRPGLELRPFREGGSGSRSEADIQPEEMPFRLEAGTPNAHGLAGLSAGLAFIRKTGLGRIRAHEQKTALVFLDAIDGIAGVRILSMRRPDSGIAVFSIDGISSQEAAAMLDSSYGVAVRGGLHCAPGAHRVLGTFPDGALRASFGYFNTEDDALRAAEAVAALARAAKSEGL